MIRYLKYIFLVFALLAIGIGSFFFMNNKQDIMTALDWREKLSYDYVSQNCPEAEGSYYYPCFADFLRKYMNEVSVTGISIGLKFAFNFLEEDKAKCNKFETQRVRDINYSINYLEVNNLAIENSYKRYFGFDFTYSGYIGKLEEYYINAFEFTENLIFGLRGKDGISSIQDENTRQLLSKRMQEAINNFEIFKSEGLNFVKIEKDKILSKVQ